MSEQVEAEIDRTEDQPYYDKAEEAGEASDAASGDNNIVLDEADQPSTNSNKKDRKKRFGLHVMSGLILVSILSITTFFIK